MLINFLIGMLIAGITTFGGGPVFIPLMEQLFVFELEMFTDETFASIVAVVNSLPGPTGPKIAGYASYLEFGVLGFFCMYVSLILPAVFLMIFAYRSLEKIKTNKKMRLITVYIKPVIMGIFLSIAYKFAYQSIEFDSILNYNNITLLIFAATCYYLLEIKKVPILFLILMALTLGVFNTYVIY